LLSLIIFVMLSDVKSYNLTWPGRWFWFKKANQRQ